VQPCSKASELVILPRACQLSYAEKSDDVAYDTSSALLELIRKIPASFWGLRLALRVLEQRAMGERSPLNTYLRHLPSVVQGMPMFFSRVLL
jgi:hypothetical protein